MKKVIPLKFERDGVNGDFTWYLRVEETKEDGSVFHGPMHLRGVSTEVLNSTHDGKHENFLVAQKDDILKHYDDLMQDHSEAELLTGKPIG